MDRITKQAVCYKPSLSHTQISFLYCLYFPRQTHVNGFIINKGNKAEEAPEAYCVCITIDVRELDDA